MSLAPPSGDDISRPGSSQSSGSGRRRRKETSTTTISGGTTLGVTPSSSAQTKNRRASSSAKAGSQGQGQNQGQGQPQAQGQGQGQGQKKKPQPKVSASDNGQPKPPALNRSASSRKRNETKGNGNGGKRSASSTSTATPASTSSAAATSPSQGPGLHTPVTAPMTAMEAATVAAAKKHGGDAMSSLQRMITDLKSISPVSSAPKTANSASGSGSTGASPVTIPGSASSATKKQLKADAPSFTPSFQSASLSPRAMSVISQDLTHNQPPAQSSAKGRKSFGAQQLQAHPELDQDELSPYAQHESQFAQQQLYQAAQQQQLQLAILQQQIQQQQLAAAQQQQQQPMGSFTAPRFQALAASRAQQNQSQLLLQAQAARDQLLREQMFQQQQLMQQQQDALQPQQQSQQQLLSPSPVFEEDSPEPPAHKALSPGGRPQLAPGFTFGAAKRDEHSTGGGGAAAAGLVGLAARAHKRTGSELTPAMVAQLEIQQKIEALQREAKALQLAELAGQAPAALSEFSNQILASTPRDPPRQAKEAEEIDDQVRNVIRSTGHRRIQSSAPSAGFGTSLDSEGTLSSMLRDQQTNHSFSMPRNNGDMPPPPVPSSQHGRRHSMNVLNKSAGQGAGFSGVMGGQDIPEDGFGFQGHHRSGSRAGMESGSWRMSGGGSMSNNNGGMADLASAQAQLQSLAQFRAQAGAGHSKMASFSFPNMLPNLMAASSMNGPAGQGQSLWQQQQAFQMQLQQTSQGPQRKSLFAPYLPQASLPPLLSAGKLVVGVLRVNKRNRSDAYVATDVLEADIYICGSKDRNRALEGDIVAVELLDVDEVWGTKKEKEEKKRKKEENSVYDYRASQSYARKSDKKKDDVEVEGQGLMLFDDEEVTDDTKPTYAGHVVAVVERMPGQLFSGQLGVLRPSSAATKEKQEAERRERDGDREDSQRRQPEQRPKIVWFKPTDKRVPLIAIPTEQAPEDFVDNADKYTDRLFVACIKRWPITSLHPFGTLVEELGPIGDTEVETSALLKDCNFPTEDFGEPVVKCLPPLPWSIPERELELRDDLREKCLFTIDPVGAKDLDDAVSVEKNEDGTFSVGVHIADVSYFVKANSALDRDARKRAITVYLVQRAVPMLPPLLSEELCSLVPGVDRLAFSAKFKLDADGNVLERSFGRSVINSCAQLSYKDAQTAIDGGKVDAKVESGHQDRIADDIRTLNELGSKLRQRRFDSGALRLSSVKLSFTLDDKGNPVDCSAYDPKQANWLIEEFMLLTNTSVARVIAAGMPEQALLRRHENPIERRLDGFAKRAAKLGFEVDVSSAGSVQKSLNAIEDPTSKLALQILARKSMQRAKYFCTGMLDIAKYSHFALNEPVYTHFTSPIRRYGDVLVHRMLDACIAGGGADAKFGMDREQVAKCAQQCNMKKDSAKLAQEQSAHLHLCLLVHDLTERYGPVIRPATVIGVLDAAFDVVVPEFGIEKRVHVDKMPVDNAVYDEHKDTLSLYWTSQDVLSFLAESNDDEHLQKVKALRERHARTASEKALVEDSSSKQRQLSAARTAPQYDGLRKTSSGHKIQEIKELMTVPVIVSADLTTSPPVLILYACNPYASA